MEVMLTSSVFAALLAAARAAFPQEACGILLGERRAGREHITAMHAARNVHSAPQTHFEIDPQALIDAHRAARAPGATQVIGYYHSHPNGHPEPSPTDRAQSARDGTIWAIVAGDTVQFWRDGEDGFTALSFTIIES